MDILDTIVARKKEEVALARRQHPERLIREQAARPHQRRPFLKRLQQPTAGGRQHHCRNKASLALPGGHPGRPGSGPLRPLL